MFHKIELFCDRHFKKLLFSMCGLTIAYCVAMMIIRGGN
jgi:hypothetical protein